MSASVLFADDSPSVRMIVNGILQTLEVQTIECKDGVEAIEYLQAHKVDVILLDLNMPRADGVEVTSATLDNGLLNIDVALPLPERNIRKIEIDETPSESPEIDVENRGNTS